MKLGSLFDGSGGFPLAGVMHGVTPVWASEIEPYPIKVTKARFPGMKHLGDVTKIDGAAIEPVDIITFGSPCQDLSVAGKQAGLHKGERSNLFFEAIRIIKEMRRSTDGIYPRIAVWENVPGAYSSNKGEDFRAVLQAFCSVKDETADVPRLASGKWHPAGAIVGNGWSVAWRTFDAQYWGVPQRRKRIYLIADFGSERAGEILFEQEGLRWDSAESGAAGQGTSDDAEGSAGGSLKCLTPWDVQSKRIYQEDSKWPGLCTGKRICDGSVLIFSAGDAERGVGGGCEVVGFQSSQSGFRLCATHATLDANNGSRRQNGVCYPAGDVEGSVGRGHCTIGFSNRGRESGEVTETLRAEPHGAYPMVAYAYDQYNGAIADKQASLGTNCGMSTGRNGICYSAGFKAGNSAQAHGIGWQEEISPTLQAGEGGNQKPVVCYAVRTRNTMANGWGVAENAYTLDTSEGQAVAYSVDCRNMNLTKEHGTLQAKENGGQSLNYMGAVIQPVVYAGVGVTSKANGQNPQPGDPCPTLHNDSRNYLVAPVVNRMRGFGDYEQDEKCSAVKARDYKDATDLIVEANISKRRYIIRRLTPLETCRLQGFPDWWEDGVAGTDSARYKMWGNGIALPCAAYIVGCAVKLIEGGL